jgi:hypothetical protein
MTGVSQTFQGSGFAAGYRWYDPIFLVFAGLLPPIDFYFAGLEGSWAALLITTVALLCVSSVQVLRIAHPSTGVEK